MPRLARAPAGALRGTDHEEAAHPGPARGVISGEPSAWASGSTPPRAADPEGVFHDHPHQHPDRRHHGHGRATSSGAHRVRPELVGLIGAEERLQADTLRLIPSENYVSAAVLEASGSVLQNKYSEGYPGKRYYEGQQVIDRVETLAIRRAQALFGMDHANVQPYSGSPANLAAYLAFLQPGDTVLGMSLPMGGHLTHGWDVSATGRWFRGVRYGVRRDTGRIDLDEVRDLARAERPRLIFCGGTAVPARSTSRASRRSPVRPAPCWSPTSRTSPA